MSTREQLRRAISHFREEREAFRRGSLVADAHHREFHGVEPAESYERFVVAQVPASSYDDGWSDGFEACLASLEEDDDDS